ncbi:MAG: TonB-dependent receptor, partial [Flavobacteriales bacterium]
MKTQFLLLIISMMIGQVAVAQDSESTPKKIKGLVYTTADDHENHDHAEDEHYDPLPFATVMWKGTQIGTSTDINGFFRLETTELTDTLMVSFVGYGSSTLVYSGQKMLEIVLNPGSELEAAEIIGEREGVSISLLDPRVAQTISAGELTRDACCNLSESFETNATVDASFTDAVTGTRQIKMLGLDGKYSLIMKDNIPNIRGLGVIFGLGYIPGPWVYQISLAKGTGAIASGYESMTGEINVAMKDPSNAEKFHFNAYANQGGRLEVNVLTNQKVSDRWSTTVLGHSEWNNQRMDRNNDGFLDNPLKEDIIIRNEWHYTGPKGLHGKYQLTALGTKDVAGQTGVLRSGEPSSEVWGMNQNTQRIEGSAKTSISMKRQSWRGFGSQFSGVYHKQDMRFGNRIYNGEQVNFRGSILYNSILGNTNHTFVTGLTFVYDDYQESLDSASFNRTERVPGAFFEYTWNNIERFTLVAGGRLDYHNQYGLFYTPRLHMRYSLNEMNSIKVSAGKGYRLANVIMENVGRLASNREFVILSSDEFGFGVKPEESWSFGANFVSKFRLNYRDASFSADFYSTQFVNQTVIDLDADAQTVLVYNLQGKSWSNSAQAEFAWTPRRRVDVRMAYRWLDVQTDYIQERRFAPFVSKHRGFITASYKTKSKGKPKPIRGCRNTMVQTLLALLNS